mgnify:CR=1 FL=1
MLEQTPHEYRVRWDQKGGHVHCRVFSRRVGSYTFAKLGELVLAVEEFDSFEISFRGAEFLTERETG